IFSLISLYVLVQSPFGRSLTGIRERELRMQILGYNTWLHKYIAFVLGGACTLVGAALGSVIVFGLREYLSTLVPWWQYVLGAVYVLTILYLPTGVMGIPARVRQYLASSRGKAKSELTPKELASEPS